MDSKEFISSEESEPIYDKNNKLEGSNFLILPPTKFGYASSAVTMACVDKKNVMIVATESTHTMECFFFTIK